MSAPARAAWSRSRCWAPASTAWAGTSRSCRASARSPRRSRGRSLLRPSSTATRRPTIDGSGCSASRAIATGRACCGPSIAPTSPRTSGSARRWADARTARRSSPSSTSCSRRAPSTSGSSASTRTTCGGRRSTRCATCSPTRRRTPLACSSRWPASTASSTSRSSTPVRFEPAPDHVAAPGRVPTLGEHTAEVLAELGLSDHARLDQPQRAVSTASASSFRQMRRSGSHGSARL